MMMVEAPMTQSTGQQQDDIFHGADLVYTTSARGWPKHNPLSVRASAVVSLEIFLTVVAGWRCDRASSDRAIPRSLDGERLDAFGSAINT